MSNLKNIIIVNDFDYIQGGASKVAIDTANLLVENCKDVNVYFFSGVHTDKSTLNEKVINVCTNQKEVLKDKNKIRGAINGIYNFKAKNQLKKLLKTLDKDKTVVHVHGWTKCLSSSIFDIAFRMNYKIVLTMHDYFTACPNGGYFNYKKNEICHMKPLSWKCIKCNCDSRNYRFKLYRIVRQFVQNKIVKLNYKIRNVISLSDLQWTVLKDNFQENINTEKIQNPIELNQTQKNNNFKDNNYYLYVGRVAKEKDVETFCKACEYSQKNGVVVGDGEDLETLKNKYKNIEFAGWQDKNQVKNWMLNAKALVFTTLLYEGAPLTIEEALSVNLPCIVSDCSSAIEKIFNGKNGLIFKTNDYKSLANSMEKIDKLVFEHIDVSIDSNTYIKKIIDFYLK